MANDKFHTEATVETNELLKDMIQKHHPHLRDNEFLIMMKHGGWKSKGKTKFSGMSVLNEAIRMITENDAILYLNADMWNQMAEPQKRYVLDNALFGLDVKKDKNKDVLEADDGRPLLKTLPPDIEAFYAVISRHGAVSEDVKRLALAIKEVNVEQITLELAASDQEKQETQQEPREGIKGMINPDGTIDINDPNQAKLPLESEEVAAAAIIATTQEGVKVPVSDDDLPF
ncbi:putative metallopeptidase [Paenibacillus amylolyticus]|uniref:putative metallopeptidase n=1 Tax=Paenibacillus amylolyticus TaxID=1451 RepID=UPI0032424649